MPSLTRASAAAASNAETGVLRTVSLSGVGTAARALYSRADARRNGRLRHTLRELSDKRAADRGCGAEPSSCI